MAEMKDTKVKVEVQLETEKCKACNENPVLCHCSMCGIDICGGCFSFRTSMCRVCDRETTQPLDGTAHIHSVRIGEAEMVFGRPPETEEESKRVIEYNRKVRLEQGAVQIAVACIERGYVNMSDEHGKTCANLSVDMVDKIQWIVWGDES